MSRTDWPTSLRNSPARIAAAAEFDRLVREHVPAFYRSAYRWTGTVDRAEDLVQELLTRLYPMLEQLRALDRLRPWAMRVMYRIFVDHLRRERNSPLQYGLHGAQGDFDDEDDAEECVDAGDEPPELVEQLLTRERLVVAWALLGEEHRIVLSMHDIEGYTLVDLAAMMDIPIGTLKSRLHRARARLRSLLTAAETERFARPARVSP